MAKWLRTLDLRPHYAGAKAGSISVPELSKIVSERLRKLRIADDMSAMERDELADDLEYIAEQPQADPDEFDEVMANLYDWADTTRTLVKTF